MRLDKPSKNIEKPGFGCMCTCLLEHVEYLVREWS